MADSELASDDGDPNGLQECADRYIEMLIGHSLEEVHKASFRLPSPNLRNILDDPELSADARRRVATLIGMQLTTVEAEGMREDLENRLMLIEKHANNIPHSDAKLAEGVASFQRCNIMHDAIEALRNILSGDR